MRTKTLALIWIDQQVGKELDWPNSGSGAQCVDLVAYYLQYLGRAWPGAPGAKDLWDRDLGPDYVRSKTPAQGAIAVWSGQVGKGFGHTALVRDVMADGTFKSLDQNYVNFSLEKGSKGAWVQHNMSNILGFFVPQFTPEPAAAAAPAPAPAASNLAEHIIAAGDTFWGLEERYSWQHGALQNLNPNLDPRKLKVGQAIKIPVQAAASITPTSTGRRYTIMPGDTFWGLEEKNGWSHGTLQNLNPGVNPKTLQIRSEINIP